MAQPNQLNPVVETINAKKVIISATTEGATRTLHPSESGSLIALDRAAGIVITLPKPNANAGIYYDFIVKTSVVTPNAYKIVTDASTTYVLGSVLSVDTDSADAIAMFVSGALGTAVAISMDSGVTGGRIGSRYKVTSVDATHWLVEGINYGTGTVATPFADS